MTTVKDEPEAAPPTVDTSTPSTCASSNKRRSPATDDPSVVATTAKRARQPHRNEDWWFADGSVVLELHGVQFRLHRSTLAAKSIFFENLFKEPTTENVEGCPLYVLDRGAPEDFAAFLTADQGLDMRYNTTNDEIKFPEIFRILRIASLYELRKARAWALDMAMKFYPVELEDDPRKGGNAIDALIAARECHAPELLKGCFFEIICFLLDGNRACIPAADLNRVLAGRGKIERRWVEEMSRPPDINCPRNESTCMNSSSRARDRVVAWTDMMHKREEGEESMFQGGLTNPFAQLDDLARIVDWKSRGYCEVCASTMRSRWAALRVKWWDNLDDLLGLKEHEDGVDLARAGICYMVKSWQCHAMIFQPYFVITSLILSQHRRVTGIEILLLCQLSSPNQFNFSCPPRWPCSKSVVEL